MTKQAITGLQSEISRAKELFASLSDDEWAAQSGCVGWRLQDVAQHMAAVYQQIAAPETIDAGESGKSEVAAEVPVQARKDWTPAEVKAAYDEWSEKGLVALTGLQEAPMADTVVPLSDLGEHPLHLLGNAVVFDGPAASSFCITPGDPAAGPLWVVANVADDVAPVVRTTAHDFVSRGTKRADWRDTSTGDVNNQNVAAVLDAINII